MWKNENKTWRFHDEFEEDSIATSIELLEKSQNLESLKANQSSVMNLPPSINPSLMKILLKE